ncbi:sugar ABC transporter permease [Paenibacillus marchantiophytorum]|uniref:Sugar ABC transporter permease n=1 Tax=Paenibacillus marchantiophytorum TaxID=1619310 RepID=A0ABQ2BUR8_9BACL|nr:carbohydrate ABC transporter permease [Paenibacillus marchantiophytorum]GGI46633.1 sugar ABC transporter permease [Paenibacillus marchantiophytorum]
MLRLQGKQVLFNSFLWIYGIISLYPILYMLFYSLKNNNEIFFSNPLGIPLHFRFENYTKAVSAFNVVELFKNSVIVSVISIACILVLSLGFAYATARISWRFRNVAYTYLMLGLFIPVQVIMIPLAILVKDIGFANTYFSLIVPYTAFNLAFSTLIFYGYFRTIPIEIEESAYMDGASIYRTFAQIIVPLVKPSIATVTIFAFLNIWNEYPMALILVTNAHLKTLPTGLISFVGQFSTDWGAMGAAMVLSSLPTIIVYLLLSEQVEKALTVGSAVKG